MKILAIHADYVEFEAKKKAFKGAEEGIQEGKQRVEECLVIFTAVEKRDETNEQFVLKRYVEEIEKIATQVNTSRVVLYPYAHLSSNLSKPLFGQSVMQQAEKELRSRGEYEVHRAPFGWYKAFNVSCKGHPLSELSRSFGPEERSEGSGSNKTYEKLMQLLDENKATYRLIDHEPEGQTDLVSKMRGNTLCQAAKCIIVLVKNAKGENKYVLAVVPGDVKVDLDALKKIYSASYVSFAPKDVAENLAGSVSGTVLPISFNPELELVIDPSLLDNEELFFNAARLDRSLALNTDDYVKIAKPRLEKIASKEVNLKRESKDEKFEFCSDELSTNQKLAYSTAALIGIAAQELFEGAKIGSLGFYNDQAYVDIAGVKLKQDDLNRLTKHVKKLRSSDLVFMKLENEKVDGLQGQIQADINGAVYQIGEVKLVPFYNDPFVYSSKEIGAFKILNTSSAYWKNNEANEQLSRVNVVAFADQQGMQNWKKEREEAEKRSHMRIGKDQGLFVISDLVGAGLPLLSAKGNIIRREVVNFLWELHQEKAHHWVWTPHIAKDALYKTSGHWEKFGDELFKVHGKTNDVMVMKPMNCPHHMQIFDSMSLSYRDMPIRLFEPATVYRDEKSGQLHGLSRVRAITQDDGHLFCRVSQIKEEVSFVVSVIRKFFAKIGMNDYWVSLSVRGDDKSKYLGADDVWEIAEKSLQEAADENELNYKRIEGEAAFYGPKLDFMFKDALSREWQLSTIQCDFNLPERFELSFMNEESKKERPVVIHRAISGSLERFMSVLIEHFGGKFPLWLSPVQVKVVTVNDSHIEHAYKVAGSLREKGLRVEVDDRVESIGKKVRDAQLQQVNYIITIGDKEVEKNVVAIRTRKGDLRFEVPVEEFVGELVKERDGREL